MRILTLCLLLVVAATTVLASPSRRLAVRDVEPVYGALDSLSDLFNMLQRAATIGKEELDKVLADPRVDALIQKLTGFARHTALTMIKYFRSLLEKSDDSVQGYGTIEEIRLFEKVLRTLTVSADAGKEQLRKALEDPQLNLNLFIMTKPFVRDMYQKMLFNFQALAEEGEQQVSAYAKIDYDMSLMDDIYKLLAQAKQMGLTVLRDFLASKELANLIDAFLSPELSEMVKAYVELVKESINEMIQPNGGEVQGYGVDNDMEILKEIWHALSVAANAGKETLLRVIRDPTILESVNKLGAFARSSALKMLAYFENKLQDHKPQAVSADSPASIVERVHQMLERARKLGLGALKDLLASEQLANIIKELPEEVRLVVQAYVDMFKEMLQEMIEEQQILAMIAVVESGDGSYSAEDEAIADLIGYAATLESLDAEQKVTAAEILRLIRRYVEQSALEGKAKLREALASEQLHELVSKLPAFLQRATNVWLETMSKLLDMELKDAAGNLVDKVKSMLQ